LVLGRHLHWEALRGLRERARDVLADGRRNRKVGVSALALPAETARQFRLHAGLRHMVAFDEAWENGSWGDLWLTT
jgi:hypothetical protein